MNRHVLKSVLVVLLVLAASLSIAQERVKWSSQVVSGQMTPGSTVTVEVDAAIDSGWHLYALPPTKADNVPTTFKVLPPAVLAGTISQTKPELKFDRSFNAQVEFFEKVAKFTLLVKLGPDGKGNLSVMFETCNASTCIPPKTVTLAIGGGATPVAPGATSAGSTDQSDAERIKLEQQKGLLSFIVFAFGAGLLALLTPCVFPMVPITVSYFAKQRDATDGKAGIAQPVAYCVGIISAFTGFGLLVSILFGASGIQTFATNPVVNLVLAALFVGLALNLFGVYELALPVSLQNRFSHRGKSGLLVPLLMGLTFTLTSFTCTVPFVGTILVSAAHGDLVYPLVGMLAFSTAFALPFFLLALFPQYLAKLPKSGSWLAAVKGFMGFLEIAAAVKFFSNADLVWGTGVLSRSRFLIVWVVVFATAALFLVGIVKLPKVEMPKRLGPARLVVLCLTVLSGVFFAMGATGRSLGDVEAYLPPDKSGWIENYQKALDLAARTNKPVFINFTGVTCTNCRWMEKNMFPRQDVTAELSHYVELELFTDKQSQESENNQALQQKLTGTVTLPVYLSVSPTGKVLAKFESSTTDPQKFIDFLRRGRSGV